MASSSSPPLLLLLLLLFFLLLASTIAASASLPQVAGGGGVNATWTPMRVAPRYMPFLDGIDGGKMTATARWGRSRRRRLVGRFQICAVCTCCGGGRGVCVPAPCCYAINCNIPNRPFGVCSFTPRTCNCLNCHL